MKRLASIILALVLILSCIPSAFAASDEFVVIDGTLAEYNGSDVDVVIPDGVISIGSTAFSWNSTIFRITIPDSVTTINAIAFRDCTNLSDVIIGKNLSKIWASAFSGCDKLSNVYYAGTESDWNKILIGEDNQALLDATIHYNSTNLSDGEPTVSNSLTPQQAAQNLYELGLFNGTGTDTDGNPIFDLDRAPTRHEAVTMLVRLLGKGEEA